MNKLQLLKATYGGEELGDIRRDVQEALSFIGVEVK